MILQPADLKPDKLLGLFALANNISAIALSISITGLDVVTKLFELITLSLGIQFIITGINGAFPKII